MALHTLPKEYAHLAEKNIRWANADKVWRWKGRGWAVNEIHGEDYGGYDSVLMIREGFEPKPKVAKKKEGDK